MKLPVWLAPTSPDSSPGLLHMNFLHQPNWIHTLFPKHPVGIPACITLSHHCPLTTLAPPSLIPGPTEGPTLLPRSLVPGTLALGSGCFLWGLADLVWAAPLFIYFHIFYSLSRCFFSVGMGGVHVPIVWHWEHACLSCHSSFYLKSLSSRLNWHLLETRSQSSPLSVFPRV